MRRRLALLPLLAAALLVPVSSASGATATVTSAADSGPGTLREAVADPAVDQIFIDSGTNPALTSEIKIDKNLSVHGVQGTLISGSSAGRVFNVGSVAPGVTVNISHLRISGGRAPNGAMGATPGAPGAAGQSGGGILNAATLHVVGVVMSNNHAGNGGRGAGGMAPVGAGGAGGSGGSGGAISNSGTLKIADSTFSANAGGLGGPGGSGNALGGVGGAGGSGGSGGAISSSGTLTVSSSTISANAAGRGVPAGAGSGSGGNGGSGGGVSTTGTAAFTGSNLSGNHAGDGGDGSGPVFVLGSGANGGRGGDGGAVSAGANSTFSNSTLSGNHAGSGGDAGAGGSQGGTAGQSGSGGSGGAIIGDASSSLTHATVASNQAGAEAVFGRSSDDGPGVGGGVAGPLTLTNTIVASNTLNPPFNPPLIPESNCSDSPVDGGHNLGYPAATGCPSITFSPGGDPLLGPLANNGGPTMTMALGPASPAIDAVPSGASCPATDQRGIARPQGVACDIGAFESRAARPAITATNPGSPADSTTPKVLGLSGEQTVIIYSDAGCTTTPLGVATAATFASPGIQVSVPPNATTTLYAQSAGHDGTSLCSVGFGYTTPGPAPAAPILTGTDPASGSNNNMPKVKGTAAASAMVQLYTDSACATPIGAATAAAAFASPGIPVTVADNSSTDFYAKATGPGGTSACSTSTAHYDELTPPAAFPAGPDRHRPGFGRQRHHAEGDGHRGRGHHGAALHRLGVREPDRSRDLGRCLCHSGNPGQRARQQYDRLLRQGDRSRWSLVLLDEQRPLRRGHSGPDSSRPHAPNADPVQRRWFGGRSGRRCERCGKEVQEKEEGQAPQTLQEAQGDLGDWRVAARGALGRREQLVAEIRRAQACR